MTRQAGDDEQLLNLRRQRDRLEAERHRLQQMRIEGDFDDDLETHCDEMDRIRREITALPTYDQIETIRITGRAIEDLHRVWETAGEADKRDLVRLTESLLAGFWARLRPGGVWYFKEVLAQDFPAHWLYRFLPSAWQWAKANTWTMYMLYNQLLSAGFEAELKRHVYYQPVSAAAARGMLLQHPGFASTLTDGAIERAIERLGALESQSELLSSEFTIIEGWAIKK